MQIKESRKTVVNTILIPYFVNIKNLDDAEIIDRLKTWLMGCNTVRSLYASNLEHGNQKLVTMRCNKCSLLFA